MGSFICGCRNEGHSIKTHHSISKEGEPPHVLWVPLEAIESLHVQTAGTYWEKND
jgi:hypothetical protein